jgi:hypothetical protein
MPMPREKMSTQPMLCQGQRSASFETGAASTNNSVDAAYDTRKMRRKPVPHYAHRHALRFQQIARNIFYRSLAWRWLAWSSD